MPARIAPQLSAQFLSRHAARLTPTRVLVHRGPTARHFSSQGPEYDWIDGAENVSGYTQGGYHPIHLGDVLHSRYEVVDKLGYGGWSTVWLVRDLHDESLVAAKVAAADSIPHEMDIIRHLQGSSSAASSIPRILDQFTIQGPNGSHPCYTTALALCTLQEDPYDGVFPLGAARAIAYRLTEAVAHVHSRGYVHGDIRLANVLAKAPSSMSSLTTQQFREQYGEPHVVAVTRTDGGEIPPGVPTDIVVPTWLCRPTNRFMLDHGHILLSDFGESFSPFSHVRLGRDCHSPIYAAPAESMFDPDAPLSFSADIWSLAVAIWDIVGMGSLFYNALTTQDENMAQMIDLLGPPPASWLDRWEARSDFFDDDGCPKDDRDVWPNLEDAFEKQVQRKRYEMSRGEFGDEEAAAFLDMMTQMLRFTPEHRPTARRILGCEWMTKWARQDSLGPGREIPQSFGNSTHDDMNPSS